MPAMTIKSIPDKVYKTLKRRAQAHHRSLNGEAIACLERSLGVTQPTSEEQLRRIDTLRTSLRHVRLTDRDLAKAKNAGRL